jgi:hypothetical protein
MSRSIKACMNCGETREIAAHGLCFRCYRQEERRIADDLWARPDPTAKELAKTQRKTRKALMKMMDALEEIESGKLVPEQTTEQWRALLRPEIERIALSLGEAQLNGEHENTGEPFTESADEPGEQVNSEQEKISEQFTDPTSQGSEPVNSEQEIASEPFTPPAEPVDQTIQSDQLASEPTGTLQPSSLPPIVPQRITKRKKERRNFHAA